MSSSQLTHSFSYFSEGWGSTTNQILNTNSVWMMWRGVQALRVSAWKIFEVHCCAIAVAVPLQAWPRLARENAAMSTTQNYPPVIWYAIFNSYVKLPESMQNVFNIHDYSIYTYVYIYISWHYIGMIYDFLIVCVNWKLFDNLASSAGGRLFYCKIPLHLPQTQAACLRLHT